MARRVAISVMAPLLPLALLLVAAVAAPLAVRAGDPCFHDLARPAVTDAAATEVTVAGECAFAPTIARVPVGTTVTFTNTSFQAHEIAGANLSWGAAQRPIAPGGTVTHTFDAAGVYPYSCMIHPGMTGAIVVGDGGESAAVDSAVGGAGPVAGLADDAAPDTPAVATRSEDQGWAAAAVAIAAIVLGLAVVVVTASRLRDRRRTREAPSA